MNLTSLDLSATPTRTSFCSASVLWAPHLSRMSVRSGCQRFEVTVPKRPLSLLELNRISEKMLRCSLSWINAKRNQCLKRQLNYVQRRSKLPPILNAQPWLKKTSRKSLTQPLSLAFSMWILSSSQRNPKAGLLTKWRIFPSLGGRSTAALCDAGRKSKNTTFQMKLLLEAILAEVTPFYSIEFV